MFFATLSSFVIGVRGHVDPLVMLAWIIGQLLVAPKFLVGLTCVGGLTWGCTEGLAILVVLATVAGVVRQVRAAVSLASLAKLLGANLLRDSLRRAPRRTFLGAGITPAVGLSLLGLALGLLLLSIPLVHDSLNVLQVRQKRARRFWDCGVHEVVLISGIGHGRLTIRLILEITWYVLFLSSLGL